MNSIPPREEPATDVVVNLTGHDIRLTDGGEDRLVPASDQVARVTSKMRHRDLLDVAGLRIPVVERFDHALTGLPEPEPGVWFVVSALVAAHANRADVVSPGALMRDPRTGHVLSARYLVRADP